MMVLGWLVLVFRFLISVDWFCAVGGCWLRWWFLMWCFGLWVRLWLLGWLPGNSGFTWGWYNIVLLWGVLGGFLLLECGFMVCGFWLCGGLRVLVFLVWVLLCRF